MSSIWIFPIILLVLALAVILLILMIVGKVKEKVRTFSRLAWGTDSITDGIEKMQMEYATTPKSVSAMTGLYLPKITADFPEFKYDEMKTRAENVLKYYLMALDREQAALLQDANQQLKDKLQAQIDIFRDAGKKVSIDAIDIHRTEISAYQKKQGRCIITFQSAVQYFYEEAEREIAEVKNSSRLLTQAKYDIDLIYVQDQNKVADVRDFGLGLNCPNCGAPIASLGEKVCEYCGTPVIELNLHVWTFGDVREVRR